MVSSTGMDQSFGSIRAFSTRFEALTVIGCRVHLAHHAGSIMLMR